MFQAIKMNVPHVGARKGWKHVHISQGKKNERGSTGWLQTHLKYINKWRSKRASRLRVAFERNRKYWIFTPPVQGVKSFIRQALLWSIPLIYISKVNV